jgi:hypothetical protein
MATSTKAGPTAVGPASTKSSVSKSTPATKGATTAAERPKTPGMGRFFIGMMVYLLAAQFFQIGLTWADVTYHWQLERKQLFTLPVIGNVNALVLIFMVVLVGLLWALYRFKVLPSGKDMAAQRMATLAAQKGGATTGKAATTTGKGAATSKANAGAKSTISKATTAGKPGATGKNTVATTDRPDKQAVATTPENDALYQQVKLQQRAQARKRSSRH